MSLFCSCKQQIASLIEYLIPFGICIVVIVLVGIIEPLRIGKGHLFQYIKELPFILKMLYIVIIGVPLFITVFCAINVFREVNFLYRANNHLLEARSFSVDSDIIFSEAEYRGEKIGNNVSIKIDGKFNMAVAVLSDDVVDAIQKCKKIVVSYGYVGGSFEIWSICVENTPEDALD